MVDVKGQKFINRNAATLNSLHENSWIVYKIKGKPY